MLLSTQIRAARALLGWRQDDLAKASEIGLATIARIEQGKGVVQGNFSTIMKIQCGFRRLQAGDPIERDHAFRSKAATFSDEGDRAPLPA